MASMIIPETPEGRSKSRRRLTCTPAQDVSLPSTSSEAGKPQDGLRRSRRSLVRRSSIAPPAPAVGMTFVEESPEVSFMSTQEKNLNDVTHVHQRARQIGIANSVKRSKTAPSKSSGGLAKKLVFNSEQDSHMIFTPAPPKAVNRQEAAAAAAANRDEEQSDSRMSLSSSCGGSFQGFKSPKTSGLLSEVELASNSPQPSTSADADAASTPAGKTAVSPPPNPTLLEGVVAFVEVRHRHENGSRVWKKVLEQLGATVEDKLSFRCTHMVFKDGTLANYRRARKLGLHIVAASWVAKCKELGQRLNETSWPCVNKEKYDSPGLFPKIRKLKSMNKNDEEFDRYIEAKVKRDRLRRERERLKAASAAKAAAVVPGIPSLVRRLTPLNLNSEVPPLPSTPTRSVINEILDEYKARTASPASSAPGTPGGGAAGTSSASPATSEDLETPFAQRVLKRMLKGGEGGRGGGRPGSTSSLPCSPLLARRQIQLSSEDEENEVPRVGSQSLCVPDKERSGNGSQGIKPPKVTRKKSSVGKPKQPKRKRVTSPKHAEEPARHGPEKEDTGGGGGHGTSSAETEVSTEEAPSPDPPPVTTQNKRKINNKPKMRQLFSQKPNDLMAETPPMTPERTEGDQPNNPTGLTVKKTTKIVRTSSRMYATQVTTTVPSRLTRQPIRSKKNAGSNPSVRKKPSKKDASSSKVSIKKGSSEPKIAKRTSRRSSIDFQSPINNNSKAKTAVSQRMTQPMNRSDELLCTSCTPEEISLAIKICADLSQIKKRSLVRSYKFKVVQQISANTTHVICGDSQKRTLNKLRAILYGCWILDKSWLFSSLENGSWVDEEPYELVDFSPAVKTMRLDREAFESDFRSALFTDVGTIYIGSDVSPSRPELQELVRLGGGTVSNVARVADVVVTAATPVNKAVSDDVMVVSEKWVLDSVQYHTPLPFLDYQIRST